MRSREQEEKHLRIACLVAVYLFKLNEHTPLCLVIIRCSVLTVCASSCFNCCLLPYLLIKPTLKSALDKISAYIVVVVSNPALKVEVRARRAGFNLILKLITKV